jgi:predicted class III extradiol MEMO1 family dioxygenase
MRKPAKAGSWYPGDPRALEELLHSFIQKREPRKINSVVVPHAGYACSGATAGKVFSVLPQADTYIIIGPNHQYPIVSVSNEPWLTPLGKVNVNSIELQLPFLQFLFEDFQIVPITMGVQGPESIKQVLDAVRRVADENTVLIASSDFTHYEPEFTAKTVDKWVIESILELNSQEFLARSRSTSLCGYGPIAVAIEFAKHKGSERGELVDYSTSADTCGDSAAVVGYAGIVMA